MIQLFQNLLITTRQSDIFINNKKCGSNLSFGQAKADTFEKSNIYEYNNDSCMLNFSALNNACVKKTCLDAERLKELRNAYPNMTHKELFKAIEVLRIRRCGKNKLQNEAIIDMIRMPVKNFRQAKELLYIKERGDEQLEGFDIVNIAELPHEQFMQAKEILYVKERGKKQLESWGICSIAKLPSDKFMQAKEILYVKERGENQLSGCDIARIAELPLEQFQQAKEILYVKERGENQLSGCDIAKTAKLPAEQFQQAKEILYVKGRGKNQLSDWIFPIAQLPPEQFKQAKEIVYIKELSKNLQLTGEEIVRIAQLPPEQFKQAKEILHVKGRGKNIITPGTVVSIAELNTEKFKQAKELLYIPELGQNQLTGHEIYWLSLLPSELFANIMSSIKKVLLQKEKMMLHPELYINGNIESSSYQKVISEFFFVNRTKLIELGIVFDDDCINNILRLRFDNAEEVFQKFYTLNNNYKVMLSKLVNSKGINGKPFSSLQKTDFIDICSAYQSLRIPPYKMQKMINENKVDIEELRLDVFKYIMKRFGLTERKISQIPREKLLAWDKKYIHKLHDECKVQNVNRYIEENEYEAECQYKYEDALKDIIVAANSHTSFIDYIHSTRNLYGQTNLKTKQAFKQLKLDYKKWIHPSSAYVSFSVKDKNNENISQIISQLEEDMNELRKNDAVKNFVDKRFSKYIKEGKFFASDINHKFVLEKHVKELIKQLSPLKQRAQNNIENDKNIEIANKTLTVFSHLAQRLEDIQKISDIKKEKTIDWTIKMWDRFPQKDLFQGNYSTCCIGIGNGNGKAMPHYLLNTAYNMIEITDSKTGKIKGNALCYFVKDRDNKPMFIIDNIEIANTDKLSDKNGIALRNAIAEYASRVAQEVTGEENTAVCVSDRFNDVPVEDLKGQKKKVSLVGNIDSKIIYMDLFDGWVVSDEYTNTTCKLLKLL